MQIKNGEVQEVITQRVETVNKRKVKKTKSEGRFFTNHKFKFRQNVKIETIIFKIISLNLTMIK